MSGQEGIAAVLAAHRRDWDDDCSCSEYCLEVPYEEHVAAAVVAWIEETLASEAAFTAVRAAIAKRQTGHGATAALDATAAALRDQP